jgi:hydroxymethylpyrimidine kinase/phosphomethylpyrimidine kinase
LLDHGAVDFRHEEMKRVLTIAGSDSSGGAGMQADIKTITRIGCHALSAITALTAQNSEGVQGIYPIPASFVSKQIAAVMANMVPDAIKLGMIYTATTIKAVARLIGKDRIPTLVIDPVLKSSTGGNLLEPGAVGVLKKTLLPLSRVVTPNLHEAEMLSGIKVRNLEEMEEASKVINALGPAVVIKGGHLQGEPVDVLFDGKRMYHFRGARIVIPHTHGTGCVFSSALAAFLALDYSLKEAVKKAHDFVREAIKKGYPCGTGAGPVNPAGI